MELSGAHKLACIHGRFQPFHLGHLDYLLRSLEAWDFIYIGLTACFPGQRDGGELSHRDLRYANPLTYVERCGLIRAVIRAEGIDLARVDFVPFPIDKPDDIQYVISRNVVCSTTNLYEWNSEKIKRLESAGYVTHVLQECVKLPLCGSLIRKMIVEQDDGWKRLVPAVIVPLLESLKIRERLIAYGHPLPGYLSSEGL